MSKYIKTTILGCGSSGGVPRVGGDFGRCNPEIKENYRTRCGIMVQKFDSEISDDPTLVLIDTSPDLRAQLLAANVKYIDTILYTHDHADQCHGIDDVRPLAHQIGHIIDAYMDPATYKSLTNRFDYIFNGRQKGGYPPLMEAKLLPEYGNNLKINGHAGELNFIPLHQIHGRIDSVGYRYSNTAYCNDLNILPEESQEHLHGLDYFIVDALRYKPHPSHAHLELALEWVEKLKPRKTILTNLHIDMDYQELLDTLPENVIPAYDGMEIIEEI